MCGIHDAYLFCCMYFYMTPKSCRSCHVAHSLIMPLLLMLHFHVIFVSELVPSSRKYSSDASMSAKL
jgi:hypothetical protein